MTQEETLTALYEKMAGEQDKYRDWLKSQPAAEVLNHAYEYTVREDIVMCMEELELTEVQAKALLALPAPLTDVYKDFEKLETSYSQTRGAKKLKVQTRAISPYVKKRNLWKEIFKNKEIYLLALPAVIWYIVFSYMPMGGLTLAFKSFKAKLGIWGSPWVGWTHFESLFQDPAFARSVGITLWINLVELLLCFPAPILLALMLNELRLGRYKKILQTVFTLPHFLSWVIIGSIVKNLFSIDGVINGLMAGLGMDKVSFLGNKDFFRPLLYCSEIWKEAGWSSIIYLAAISGVDPELYEVAEIDGATRLQRIIHITLPGVMPTIAIMLVLQMGGIMGGHFDQIYNLQNDVIASAAETLNMYIYRITFQRTPNYGFSTAVSLFCSVINMLLLLFTNKQAERFGGVGLMGGIK